MLDGIHLIRDEDGGVIFHPPSYTLIRTSRLAYNIVDDLQRYADIVRTSQLYAVPILELKRFIEHLQMLGSENGTAQTGLKTDKSGERSIGRITLHVSNDCNLRCMYCYANGGHYKSARKLMTIDTARAFVDFCEHNFDKIGVVVFFGGEPFLNMNAIEYVCKEFEARFKTGNLKQIPEFGAVTNGTILDSRILAVIKRYFSFLTVSIDGSKEINDKNRVDKNGSGTYDIIAKFITTVRSKTNVRIQYEATYTQGHIDAGISTSDVTNHLRNQFELVGVITDELSLKQEGSQSIPSSTINATNIRDMVFPEGFWSILTAIVLRRRKEFCQIIKGIVSISVDGIIYPCHMDNDNPKLRLGSIFGDNIYNNTQRFSSQLPLYHLINDKDTLCGDCWAVNICAGCTRKWFLRSDGIYGSSPKSSMCKVNQEHIDSILLLIVKIRRNAQLWRQLCDMVNNKSTKTT